MTAPIARRSAVVRRDGRPGQWLERPDPYHWLRVDCPERAAYLRDERAHYDEAMAALADRIAALVAGCQADPDISARELPVAHRRYIWQTSTPEGATLPVTRRWPVGSGSVGFGPAGSGPPGELVLDHHRLDAGTGYLATPVLAVSPDESLLAVGWDCTGDERLRVRFVEAATGDFLPDVLDGVADAGVAWGAHSASFYYTVPDATGRPWAVRRHRLGGGDQRTLLVEDDLHYFVTLASSGGWIVADARSRTSSQSWVWPADESAEPVCVRPRVPGVQYSIVPLDADTAVLIVVEGTSSTWAVCPPTAGVGEPAEPADPDLRLHRATRAGDRVVLTCRRGNQRTLRIVDPHRAHPSWELSPSLPGGTIDLLPGGDPHSGLVTIAEQSLVIPLRSYTVDLSEDGSTGQPSERRWSGGHPVARPSVEFVTDTRWIDVGDTQVPVTITRHRDVPLDGGAPALLTGYGAYETVFEPQSDAMVRQLLRRGVVHAHVHVRGGGELGRGWYLAARMATKERTFSDYLAVADSLAGTLVDGARMASRGMSAGGLLQAVCLTRRPDRFTAIVAEVPFTDVVTSMFDPTIPLTVNEHQEWGDPRVPEQLRWLLAYSPCDTMPPPTPRPALLVTGAVHDARVLIHEPALWVARLRHSNPSWADPSSSGGSALDGCLFRAELGACSHDGPSYGGAYTRYDAEVSAWLLHHLGCSP